MKSKGFIVARENALVTYGSVGEAVSRGKVHAHGGTWGKKGRPIVVYELVEVYRIEPTDTPNVEPPRHA